MNIIEEHRVPEGISSVRVEEYALDAFMSFQSRKSIKKTIKRGELRIDGQVCRSGAWVRTGQSIELLEPREITYPVYERSLTVRYEDRWLAVVEKPAGLRVNGNQFKTVENALPHSLELSPERDVLARPRPVHRLDSVTPGLLVVAKTSSAMIGMSRLFQERKISKKYSAIVMGRLEGKGIINGPIEGRQARTSYEAVKSVRSLKNEWLTLVDLYPETGRKHQLRRHLSGLGYPILGDSIYGPEGLILRGKGILLCAVEVSFRHPVTHESMVVSMDRPVKFDSLMKREERRWEKYNG